jgi:hypothetical protein
MFRRILFLSAVFCASAHAPLFARQEYNRVFWKTYQEELGKFADTTRCNACHYGAEKKNRNDYGQAVGTALGKTGVKDADEIGKALKKAADQKSSVEGKTFADLIQAGKLPGKRPD